MHLDALKLADALRDRLAELALDEGQFKHGALREAARSIWSGRPDDGGLVGEVWVEGAFAAESSGLTLQALSNRGWIDPGLVAQLAQTGAMPADRPLYTHQSESLGVVHEARMRGGVCPGLVVTAGTGAGKTESFLLPALDVLWRDPGKPGEGMSALLLYPMNALVVDQVGRLASWLAGQTRVTFFHFTSETPEDHDMACTRGIAPRPLPYFRTRRQARGQEDAAGKALPEEGGRRPDVVVTNYSMLEYMLCRPQDGVFFGKNLRVVVLDEAHLYNGTLAAEIALQLRRLLERCGKRPEDILFLAASATLGSGSEEQIRQQLREFGAHLSSKHERDVTAIVGKRQAPAFEGPVQDAPAVALEALQTLWQEVDTLQTDAEGHTSLKQDEAGCAALLPLLQRLCHPALLPPDLREPRPAALLHHAMPGWQALRQAAHALFARERMPLRKLADELWGTEVSEIQRLQATLRLLALGSSARRSMGDLPLLPHRLHVPARGAEGLSVCLAPGCTGPRRLPGRGSLLAGHQEHCPFCGAVALPLLHCETCHEPLLVSRGPRTQGFDGAPEDQDRVRGWTSARIPPRPGYYRLGDPSLPADPGAWQVDPRSGELGDGEARLDPVPNPSSEPRCPGCGEQLPVPQEEDEPNEAISQVRAYQTGAPLTTIVLTETILPALPPHPSALKAFLPAQGRRLLAFSDSRRSAARLGPFLTDSHGRRVMQAALAQFLQLQTSVENIEALELQAKLWQDQLSKNPNNAKARAKLAETLAELQAQRLGFPIEDLPGALQSEPRTADHLAQLLDQKQADSQELPWTQDTWDANRKHVLEPKPLLVSLGRELARRPSGQRTLETLGLADVLYPQLDTLLTPHELLIRLPEVVRAPLQHGWSTLLSLLCDTLRMDGMITLGSDEQDEAYAFGGGWLGRWMSEDRSGWRTDPFVGSLAKQRRRALVSGWLLRLGCPEAQADACSQDVLRAAFRQLSGASFPWIEVQDRLIGEEETARTMRLLFPRLAVNTPRLLWQSPASGRIWSRALVAPGANSGLAPELGCADLVSVTPRQLDLDARVGRARRELLGNADPQADDQASTRLPDVFRLGLWAEEHSAQRSPQQNRRLQGLFEAGARNVLSASTTLEVGIDIGGLQGVVVANAPPGKASYLQRAGRAGRRTDGSSVVVAFCHPRPFDREVFARFDRYIGRALRRPRVLFDRPRIALRHAHAWLLGDFFRQTFGLQPAGAMNAFGRLEGFLGLSLPGWWEAKSPHKPPLLPPSKDAPCDQFAAYLRQLAAQPTPRVTQAMVFLLAGTPLEQRTRDLPAFLAQVVVSFEQALSSFRQDLDELGKIYGQIPVTPKQNMLRRERAMAQALRKQLETIASTTVIEALSDRQFLPKFGFPVGVQQLKVMVPDENNPRRLREEDTIRLERSSLLAMAEYIPGSRVLVGGKLVTSRGVLRHFVSNAANDTLGLRGFFATCEKNHVTYNIASAPTACHFCGRPPRRHGSLLLPRHGFISAGWDPPRRSLETRQIGRTELVTITFDVSSTSRESIAPLGGIHALRARYREDGEILVFNRGKYRSGFALCTRCGYADSEFSPQGEGILELPARFEKHAPLTSPDALSRCWGLEEQVGVLRHHVLAARQTTDLLLIDIHATAPDVASPSFAETLGRALQIAGARLLEVDTRELGVLTVPGPHSYSVALYDNLPGGVGHVQELLLLGRAWIEEARQVLFLDAEHDRRCSSACLDCILSFDAQNAASLGLLQRQCVLPLLDQWLAPS